MHAGPFHHILISVPSAGIMQVKAAHTAHILGFCVPKKIDKVSWWCEFQLEEGFNKFKGPQELEMITKGNSGMFLLFISHKQW